MEKLQQPQQDIYRNDFSMRARLLNKDHLQLIPQQKVSYLIDIHWKVAIYIPTKNLLMQRDKDFLELTYNQILNLLYHNISQILQLILYGHYTNQKHSPHHENKESIYRVEILVE